MKKEIPSKPKVLILYNKLFHYRIPIWNLLANECELTVAYSYPAKEEDIKLCDFKTLYLPVVEIGRFVIHKENIYKLAKGFDVVICYEQASYLKYSSLAFRKSRPFKLIYWSLGAPASYKRKYGEANWFYYFVEDNIIKRGDAYVVYTPYAKQLGKNRGYNSDGIFVANNTVKVIREEYSSKGRENILFIGTLYLEKGLSQLLFSYKDAFQQNTAVPKLQIIGGGDEYEQIKKWINDNGLAEKIVMMGPIYNEEKKAELFAHAIACISPLQAGLSVLESMGYGVPYITSENAITGGEAFNIEHNVSGLRYPEDTKLTDVLLDITLCPEKYLSMGMKAYNHYWTNCTPEIMASGLQQSIEFVLNK